MNIKHYEIVKPKVSPPEPMGWRQAWHGYYRFEKVTETFVASTGGKDRAKEVDILLNVISDISESGRKHINLIELGAGWGEWCLALAGIINFRLIPHNIKSYKYLAVEGVPSYCGYIHKHFIAQGLPDNVLNAAVSDEIGKCRFNMFAGKDTYYCQGMTFKGNFGGSKLKTAILALYYLLKSKTVVVPMVTVDYLMKKYDFGRVDIIHCDVQGVEDKVIRGTIESIKQGKIDYWIVGTHHKKLNKRVNEMLSPWYELLVDTEPGKERKMKFTQDGIQLYKRRGLG
jgi:FkbM family methyltransferase